MRKAERLFQVVNLLRARQPITARLLAEELAVSVRTIYRYIEDLSVNGVPVYGEPGVGYHLHKNFELPPLTLSGEELDALLLGVQMVSVSTGSRLPAAARTLLSKVEASLPDRKDVKRRQWAHAFCIKERGASTALWDVLQDAVCSKHVIRFQYAALDGVVSTRDVWPLGLFYWGGKWTIGAWCLLRRAFRDFRVDRMSIIETLDQRFEPTVEICPESYMKQQATEWKKRKIPTDTTLSVGEL
jgi:predicted DNA-binding transcriptional regulator YafY